MTEEFRSKSKGKQGFVSIHKKGLASLSLLLIIMGAAFGVLNHWYLKLQVKTQQMESQAAWRAEFKGLIGHSVDRLQRLSVVLASLGKLTEQLNKPTRAFNATELEERFSSVRYELDVERIMVFDRTGAIRWNWSPDISSPASKQLIMKAIVRTLNSEQPEAALDCKLQCRLNVVTPLLADGKHVGFIGLSQRITDLVVEFSTATGIYVGILIPATNVTVKTFTHWRLDTAALTDAAKLKPFIEHLSELYASPADIPSDDWLSWRDEDFVFNTLPLKDIVKGTNGYLVFISNITKATAALKASNRNSLVLMAASLIVAELILFLLLRGPLRRLGDLARILPLAAHGGYHDAYNQLNVQGRLAGARDEIDILYESSAELAHQIEESRLELASDRDFIQGILDSAQVMILTQTREGRIHTINRYMSQFLGRSFEDLKDQLFTGLVENDEGKERYESQRLSLFNSALHRLEHEGAMINAHGEQRHIIWIHTNLGKTQLGDVAVLSVGMDATDRIMAENRSRWLANHDPLTGLANWLRFQEELERSIANAIRSGATSALLMLDLDHFKVINDTSGHAVGDALLEILANELRARARKSDLIARLHGDEFAILMPNTGRGGAEAFAEAFNERLSERMFEFDHSSYRISASIGIALIPLHGKNVDELMINVDIAMYEAKKSGRGCWHFFSPTQDEADLIERTKIRVEKKNFISGS